MDKKYILSSLQGRTLALWNDYCEVFPKLTRFEPPSISLNGRLSRTAGRCFVGQNRIEMGTKFFTLHSDNMFRVILPHEIAHQIDFNLNGVPIRWHGKNWQDIMTAIGQIPNAYHTMEI